MLFISHLYLFLTFGLASTVAQTHGVGTLFSFTPGLGACGFTNTSEQIVASVSRVVFSNFAVLISQDRGATANPNKNPICKHKIFIKSGNKNLTAAIVDFYVAKVDDNVGLSPDGFATFGNADDGIVPNVTWSIV
ncbi:hypothetical protein BDZ97DRAFT_1761051 [Flammula alnicola]|nr:hypothetical protein BDZ97DRAFT_1761051 [Flammula alnicola]